VHPFDAFVELTEVSNGGFWGGRYGFEDVYGLPGHTDEVHCVDPVAGKVVSRGRDQTVKMCVFSFFCSCVELMSFCV
jgi:hypothetical protein